MAKPDHTAPARPVAAPRTQRKPTNPLSRPYWTFEEAQHLRNYLPASAVTTAIGIQALTRVLANSEAFRALQESCDPTEPTQTPFAADVTEGLFAALYVLSERAVQVCEEMQERWEGRREREA